MTKSLVIDLTFALEGQAPHELPEVLLGAVRFYHLDLKQVVPLDLSQEVPLKQPPSSSGEQASGSSPVGGGSPQVGPCACATQSLCKNGYSI